jgi:hypothetical protein
MLYDRDTILKDLRKNVVEVAFTKVDGEPRVMRCTLNPTLLPEKYRVDVNEQTNEKNFHKENSDVIAAWDINSRGWRSFRMDSVIHIHDVSEHYL